MSSVLRAACLLGALVLGVVSADAAPRLKRGINFEVWQSWTNRDSFLAPGFDRDNFPDWMNRVDDGQLSGLKAAGFDFVRLNVDASVFLWADEADTPALIDKVVAATKRLQALGFAVIVDLHLLPAQEDRPDGLEDVLGTGGHEPRLQTRYLRLVTAVAGRLAALPADLTLLEPINEPNQDWDSHFSITDRWPAQLDALRAAARKAAPTLTLVLTGGRSGGVDGLERLDPVPFAGDPNIVWTFHYYEPMAVTHAGQPWDDGPQRYLTHLPYPVSLIDDAVAGHLIAAARSDIAANVQDTAKRRQLEKGVASALADYRASGAGPASFAADFKRVSDWAADNAVPPERILLGEFGVFQDAADPAARRAVIEATRKAAEAAGFAWAVYTAGLTQAGQSFAVIGDNASLALDPAVAEALGLTSP
jgi:hypothetical protein